jgi:hypothetical protein
MAGDAEARRLAEADGSGIPWRRWGPYLSERQWGILEERMFGLTNSEGNHGEDVKEYYFYLDSTPTHSYVSFLYKYPQAEYPYASVPASTSSSTSARPRPTSSTRAWPRPG